MNKRDHDRLVEIQGEMLELLAEATRLIQSEGGITYERAKSYWLAQVKMGLTNDHTFVANSMCSMDNTINELDPGCDDDDDMDNDEDINAMSDAAHGRL